MAKNLYVTATEGRSGKSAVVLGMMQLLLRNLRKVAFFRPIINQPQTNGARDHDIDLVLKHFDLDIPYEETYAYTSQDARNQMNNGRHETMLETILKKYKNLESKYDFVLCEGTDFTGQDAAFEFDLNSAIAANIGSPVLIVTNAKGKSFAEARDSTQFILDQLDEKGLDVIACIVNRSCLSKQEAKELTESLRGQSNSTNPLATYVLPKNARWPSPLWPK